MWSGSLNCIYTECKTTKWVRKIGSEQSYAWKYRKWFVFMRLQKVCLNHVEENCSQAKFLPHLSWTRGKMYLHCKKLVVFHVFHICDLIQTNTLRRIGLVVHIITFFNKFDLWVSCFFLVMCQRPLNSMVFRRIKL